MKTVIRAAMVLLLAASAVAQVNGVPASVTSVGTPGRPFFAPGVPASVTSLGPLGWTQNCCIFPNFPTPLIPSAMGIRDPAFNPDGRAHHLRTPIIVPYSYPYYVPYPVPVGPDYTGEPEQQMQVEEAEPPAPTIFEHRATRAQPVASTPAPAETAPAPQPAAAPEPAAEQEPTILVFNDGKRSEIRNFAIVGDTLYELSPEHHKIPLADLNLPATVKANDERGVDFHVPTPKGS